MLDNLPPKIKNNVIILTIVVCLVTVFVGYNMVYKRFDTKSKLASTLIDMESKKKILIEEILLLQNKTASFQADLVSRRDPTWLVQELNRFAGESGLTLTSVTPKRPEMTMDFEKLSVQLEASGDYHRLGDFIAKIESYKPFLRIGEVKISTGMKTINNEAQPDYLRAMVTVTAIRSLRDL